MRRLMTSSTHSKGEFDSDQRWKMAMTVQRFIKWLTTLNSVDDPGHNSFHRFILSARLALWPAIILSSFAFGRLLHYELTKTLMLSTDLCLVASIAFLFNDTRDVEIDRANGIYRWSIRTKFDLKLFVGTSATCFFAIALSFFWLSTSAFIGVVLSMATCIAYSLICKKIFLLGNTVAALLSISPGLIMLMDILVSGRRAGQFIGPAPLFLAIAFLLLLSREIKFDQFDIAGDKIGGRFTVPMLVSSSALKVLHGAIAVIALCSLFSLLALSGRYSWSLNLMMGLITSLFAAGLMMRAYRATTKEMFYKTTRLVMLVIPLSILVSY
jgi:4-hydroxybenzoate polyprenyltransferase